jgi:LemA protein
MEILLGLGAILAVVVFFVIAVYNGLIQSKILVDEGWSGIDVQLKRRYDLIPNIVETVKGYAKHESETLAKVVELRNTAMTAKSIEEKGQIENQISGALKTIFALSENYPDLKANQGFLDLQKTLADIEGELEGARRYYNGTVRDFNTKIMIFPNNLIAGILGFKSREFFAAEEEAKANVKVDFSK